MTNPIRSFPSIPAHGSLLLLTFLSGFCGLAYELLLGRFLGNIAGDQFAVSAAVLVAFLTGIAVGARLAHHLWSLLWLVELLIGVCALTFAMGGELFDEWIYHAAPELSHHPAGLMLLCALPLLLPATLIGVSLPLFSGYLERTRPRVEDAPTPFATSYALYNFGAAITVLLIEFALLRSMGLRASLLTMAAVNLLVSSQLRMHFRHVSRLPPPPPSNPSLPQRVVAALVVASVTSAVFQLLMVKLTEFLFGPFRESFALVLTLIMLGIALGSWLVERIRLGFPGAMLLTLLGLAWALGSFTLLARGYAANYPHQLTIPWVGPLPLKLLMLSALMLLPATGFGAVIPTLLNSGHDVTRASGRLLYYSSLANVAGFLLMVFVLHVQLTYGALLLAVAMGSALALTIYPTRQDWRKAWMLVGLSGLALFHAWDEKLLYLGHLPFQEYKELVEAREELVETESFRRHQDVMAITQTHQQEYFFINGYVSMPLKSPSEVMVGAFSTLFSPRTDLALVLGVGSGKSASAINKLFQETDAVEINPAILENLPRLGPYNFDLHRASGIRFHVDDALHYVRSCPRKYDLVLNTVTSPLYFSSAKLYTREFLDMVAQRCLTGDGIYGTWMDSRIGEEGARIILATLEKVFPHVWMGAIRGTYYLMIASREPLSLRQSGKVSQHPVLAPYLSKELDFGMEQLSLGLLTTRILDYVRGEAVPINTLDKPELEFAMARSERGFPHLIRWLRENQNVREQGEALGENWSAEAQQHHFEVLLGERNGFARRWKWLAREESRKKSRESQKEATP